jgi:predicted dehydrogenase
MFEFMSGAHLPQKFRVALIGLGNVSCYHRAALDVLESHFTLSLGVDPNADRRAIYPGTAVPELEDAAFNDLDAVIVASATSTHAEVAKYALSNGCPVLLEKPAVTNLDDWTELLKTADSSGVPLETAFHARFSADRRWYQQAQRWLTAEHGNICAVHCQAFDPYIQSDELDSRVTALEGSWLDSGINALSGLDMAINDWSIESLRQVAAYGAEDTATTATVRFDRRGLPKAGIGIVETSWHAAKSWKETVLSFEESGARLHLQHSLHRAVLHAPAREPTVLFDAPKTRPRLFQHYEGVYREFLRVLMGANDNRQLSSRLHYQLLSPIKSA